LLFISHRSSSQEGMVKTKISASAGNRVLAVQALYLASVIYLGLLILLVITKCAFGIQNSYKYLLRKSVAFSYARGQAVRGVTRLNTSNCRRHVSVFYLLYRRHVARIFPDGSQLPSRHASIFLAGKEVTMRVA
jgi:hypothetical protein